MTANTNLSFHRGETRIGSFRRQIFSTPIFFGYTDLDLAKRAEELALIFKNQINQKEGLVGEKWNECATSEDKNDFDKYGVTSYNSRNFAQEEKWQDIKCELENVCKRMLEESINQSIEMNITDMWTTLYPEESFIPQHIHPNSEWSAVFYAKAEKNCGDIVWQDPSWIAKSMCQNVPTELNEYQTTYQLTPQTGGIALFPSFLPHETRPNRSGEERIIISFNLSLVHKNNC
tara:strand:+ start:699 stop:1394 length:696 start_codon:yes stop_codon:yes gene_type:complete